MIPPLSYEMQGGKVAVIKNTACFLSQYRLNTCVFEIFLATLSYLESITVAYLMSAESRRCLEHSSTPSFVNSGSSAWPDSSISLGCQQILPRANEPASDKYMPPFFMQGIMRTCCYFSKQLQKTLPTPFQLFEKRSCSYYLLFSLEAEIPQ